LLEVLLATLAITLFSTARVGALAAEDATKVEDRLRTNVEFLSSDDREGRGVGTKGLDQAADFIANEFRQLGLKTDVVDGGPFQKFSMTTGATLGENNRLVLVGPSKNDGGEPQRIELKLSEDYNPLAIGGSGSFDLPLVFVGYGISGKDENYDDYAGVDVDGKAVVILRHEPQQDNPHSLFDGTSNSRHAPFRRKVSNAYEHGAAAVIFVNDEFDVHKNIDALRNRWQAAVDDMSAENTHWKTIEKPSPKDWKKHEERVGQLADDIQKYAGQLAAAQDPLLPFEGAGSDDGEGRDFPVLACRRAALDQVIAAALGKSLAEVETEIDKGPTPKSAALAGWRIEGEASVHREESEVKNVIAVLEGAGPHADETIVVGAHYDHLGWGGAGSAAPGVKEIHNGADDNGSGTTVLLEVARQMAAREKPLPRRIVFIAFTGEERGLIGSARYVRNPLFPLEKTVAMVNLDMVGRLADEKLIVHGTGTAEEFETLVDRLAGDAGFDITKKPGGFGPSDHSSFYGAQIPVLFFFTGSHKDYHRPSDDVDKLNIAGMRRVGDLVTETVVALADAKERPHYIEVKESSTLGGGGDRPYFGSIPDFAQEDPGYALSGVTKGGPADRAGIKPGDNIIQLGDSKIGNLEDFDSALRKYKAGDKVPVVLQRDGQEVTVEVTLDPPR
jgi:Zn-dependent M28 family amino/carboxypeptidase